MTKKKGFIDEIKEQIQELAEELALWEKKTLKWDKSFKEKWEEHAPDLSGLMKGTEEKLEGVSESSSQELKKAAEQIKAAGAELKKAFKSVRDQLRDHDKHN
jgi:ElaB/YqjD/DUF883 family membrane-anchored ribosome-binding protein